MSHLFNKAKIIVCVGTGGVGKTTVAASLGIQAAKEGKRVLVLTIDPAKRLAQTLGLENSLNGNILVPEQNYRGKLYAGWVDPETCFNDFVRSNSKDNKKVAKILNNTLYKQLSTNLSGSQEFTSLDRLYREVTGGNFDLVILDTPPAQNAMDFFNAPEKIYALFQRSITRWFAGESKDQNIFAKIINRGTLTVLAALEKLTGAAFIGELADFFTSIQDIQEVISQRSLDVHKMLMEPTTQFILVSTYDKIKILEAKDIYTQFKRFGFNLYSVFINRCLPEWDEPQEELKELYSKFIDLHKTTEGEIDSFRKLLHSEVLLYKIQDLESDLTGIQGLSALSDKISVALKENSLV
ncbi:MAG: ArsA family ATPase [Bdellovibrionaceae bacterium]|nr:ArsA family ATPase [Pseudobdellovibrionaceae bacterium]